MCPSVPVVPAIGFLGAGELFEEVGVLNRGGDFVVAGGPFAEVDAAAAVGAEGEVFATGEDDVAAGGAAESFYFRGGRSWHSSFILFPSCGCRIVPLPCEGAGQVVCVQ